MPVWSRSRSQLEDSSFNLDSWIRDAFAIRLARGLEAAVTLGKDSSATTLPNQASGGLLGIATIGDTTASLAAGIGWDDFTTAFGALDPAYRTPNAKWVMNSQTHAYLIGLKDGFGRPFFTPDPSGQKPFEKIMGYDVVLNQQMPAMGASATPVLFGDLQKSYMLRNDGAPSILRLNERFAELLEVGFFLYLRIGGISLNAGINTLVSIKQASS